MTERYDLLHARKGKDGKAYWTRCGVAFPNRDGTGWNITLNYLPAPISNEGYQFAMLPPKPRDGTAAQSTDAAPKSTGGGKDFSDDIPFNCPRD